MNEQAQNNWKVLYRKARECFNAGLIGEAYERITYAQRFRREAALERCIAAQQRTIQAQAQEVTRLNAVVLAQAKQADILERQIESMLIP